MWRNRTLPTGRFTRPAFALVAVLVVSGLAACTGMAGQSGTSNRQGASGSPTVPAATPTPSPRPSAPPAAVVPGDWPGYLSDSAHSSYNAYETKINTATAPSIVQPWAGGKGTSITGDLIETNGLLYLGFWNGDMRAWAPTTGIVKWNHNLGQTTMPNCTPNVTGLGTVVGIAGTPTTTTLNGTKMLFVGGGDAQLYALDALTGQTIWAQRLGSSPDHFLWGSPVYDYTNTSVYIGVASFGRCTAVQGQIVQLDATTGTILHTFNVVPDGCTGGEVLGTPTLTADGSALVVATGDAGTCASAEPYAASVLELNASDLSVKASWQVPETQVSGGTRAFASTMTLFTATIGGTPRQMMGIANRNGNYYAFDQNNLTAGPVWLRAIAVGGKTAVQYVVGSSSGQGSVAPSSWDGTRLYVGGGQTTVGGASCKGGVRALSPVDGHSIWAQCMDAGPVVGALASCKGGIVIAGEGDRVKVMNSATGDVLYTYLDPEFMPFASSPMISHGWIYIGNADGGMHAYRV